MIPTRYNNLLHSSITQKYKKTSVDEVGQLNKDAKQLTENLRLSDRIDKLAEKDAYITLKDHKHLIHKSI